MNSSRTKLSGLTVPQKKPLLAIVIVIAVISCALAWRDLARRRDEEIRGPKFLWRLVITMNPGNSLFYWLFGRK